MTRSDDLLYWLQRELQEMKDFVAALERGQMQIRHRSGAEWVDATATITPDLRERMWQLEKLLKGMVVR